MEALYNLGREAYKGYFDFGSGMTERTGHRDPDHQEGFRLMELSAKLDYPLACSHLGMFYQHGIGCDVNKRKALKWIRKGAEKGNPWGMRLLGMAYH